MVRSTPEISVHPLLLEVKRGRSTEVKACIRGLAAYSADPDREPMIPSPRLLFFPEWSLP